MHRMKCCFKRSSLIHLFVIIRLKNVMKINAYGEVSPYSNDDYAYLKASEALFFRKAVSGISDTLIDRLEEEFYAASI